MRFRRWAIGVILAIATLLGIVGLQRPAPAQDPAPLTLEVANLRVEEVASGVYTLLAQSDFPVPSFETSAICNATIVIGSDGVLVIDPFQNEALANLAFETVATLTDQPIRYVLDTHYHFDHSGGNAAAEALGVPIIGRGPIREFMLTRNQTYDPNITPPDVVLTEDGELWLGDRQVQLVEFEGHSGGTDVIAYVPDADVLVTGDMLFAQRFPYLADGNIRIWQDNLEKLATDYASATVVPGHGPVGDRANLLTLKAYLEDLEALAEQWKEDGLTQAEAIAQTPIPEQYATFMYQAMFGGNLEVAYHQITLGHDSAAAIQEYFQAQAPELKAL